VPPWATNASFSDVVRHFLQFHPWDNTNTARLLAYFEGYQAALEAAPTDKPTYTFQERWYTDMRDCIARCVTLYREKRTTEIQRAKGTASTLQTTARTTQSWTRSPVQGVDARIRA
jgi:hypothetical protein